MASTSIRGQIFENFAARLQTITAANGYSVDVKKVHFDKVPMGIKFRDDQLPAIFLIQDVDPLETEHKVLKGMVHYRLQLWHTGVTTDTEMSEFVRAVFKAIYANSPTAQVESAFRAIHPQLNEVIPLSIKSDLNMIEANRVNQVMFAVKYRTKLFNL